MTNYTLPEQFNIPVKKLGQVFALQTENLNEATISFILAHGLKQLLNDCHAGENNLETVNKLIATKIASLEANETSSRGAGGFDCGAELKKVIFNWLVKNTGQKKKALEEVRVANGWDSKKLLEAVCGAMKVDFVEVLADCEKIVEDMQFKSNADVKKVLDLGILSNIAKSE